MKFRWLRKVRRWAPVVLVISAVLRTLRTFGLI